MYFRNILCPKCLPTDQEITDAGLRDVFERQETKPDGKPYMVLIVNHLRNAYLCRDQDPGALCV